MFNTFKFDPETRQVQQIRSAFDPTTARSNQHQACNSCHVKKLRCSGEKSGCERCKASSIVCEYTRSSSRSSRRGGSGSGSGKNNYDHRPLVGETSPGSGNQSRRFTPSPPPSLLHQTTTPWAQYSEPTQLFMSDADTIPHDDGVALSSLDLRHRHDAEGAMGIMSTSLATGDAAAYFYPQTESWHSHSQFETAPADPASLGSIGTESFPNYEEIFAMFSDLTQFPSEQDLSSHRWAEEQ